MERLEFHHMPSREMSRHHKGEKDSEEEQISDKAVLFLFFLLQEQIAKRNHGAYCQRNAQRKYMIVSGGL